MGDSHNWKPGARPGGAPSPAKPAAGAAKPPPAPNPAVAGGDSRPPTDPLRAQVGRVIHDDRGNAVWDWLKDTARTAIDSTSRLLRRLEVPELKVEDTNEQELRIESDRDAGGGYDPYGGSNAASSRTNSGSTRGAGGSYDPYAGSDKQVARTNSGSGRGTGAGNQGNARSGNADLGGGYDPYGKTINSKTTRKR